MKKLSQCANSEERRALVEEHSGNQLLEIRAHDFTDGAHTHCENMIGGTVIPLGVAGPLKIINETNVSREVFVPLATTEGALVGSINRGCKAIREAGGAHVSIERKGTSRSPVFYTGSVKKSKKFATWLKENEQIIKNVGEETSGHLTFLSMTIAQTTDHVYVNLYFDTDQAMGMNMVTKATETICAYIEDQTEASCVTIAGNYDIDKKPAWQNIINGRGFQMRADVVLTEQIVRDVLKTTPKKIFDVWLAKCMMGSALSGSLGFNAHFANIVAAFFVATGQDIAHVVEGSLGFTTTNIKEDGHLYFSVYMPSVMLGIVGGGTKLPTQSEAIRMTQSSTSTELAEVLGGAVLAGEVSLLSSLAEGSLTRAHMALGR